MDFHRLLVFFLIGFFGFYHISEAQLVVLLSKSYGNNTYEDWVKRQSPGTRTISLYHTRKDSVEYWLSHSDGFLLTGGEDIFPGRYGKAADSVKCDKPFDLRRDSLEWQMLHAAFRLQKPVFGICRGLQMLNVFCGGKLHIDVPSALGTSVSHRKGGPTKHAVTVTPGSTLAAMTSATEGEVTSNHHQGIEILGNALTPIATSADGLVEAIEMKRPNNSMFVMAVQWHPERMPENDPLSAPLAKAFVKACHDKKQK